MREIPIFERIRRKEPLVHCITNYVTANDVANMVLAVGASPIMADGIDEVEDIASSSDALSVNLGTLNERTVESMIMAGRRSNECSHPIVFDPVGAGASRYRTDMALRFLREVSPAVIRGNASEIRTIAGQQPESKGVDVSRLATVTEENLPEVSEMLRRMSSHYGAVVAVTGPIDLVVDEEKVYVIRNGHPWMSKVTGTGCMLDGVLAACLAAEVSETAAAVCMAVSAMGICGEQAFLTSKDAGTGSFRMELINAMSKMNERIWKEGANFEVR